MGIANHPGTACWTLTDPVDYLDLWEANGHWPTEQAAAEYRDGLVNDNNGLDAADYQPYQQAHLCWAVSCDACGYRYDEGGRYDDYRLQHWPSERAAAAEASSRGWRSRDGRWLCDACSEGAR